MCCSDFGLNQGYHFAAASYWDGDVNASWEGDDSRKEIGATCPHTVTSRENDIGLAYLRLFLGAQTACVSHTKSLNP